MAIRALSILKNWFKTGSYPTESQFSDVFDSFRHKSVNIQLTEVEGLANNLNSQNESIAATMTAIAALQEEVESGSSSSVAALESTVDALASDVDDIDSNLDAHLISAFAHEDIRNDISNIVTGVTKVASAAEADKLGANGYTSATLQTE